MDRAELAFIPFSGAGHLAPMVELAKTLTSQDHRIFLTIFIMDTPFTSNLNSYTQALLSNQPPPHIRFVHLTLDEATSESLGSKTTWNIELVKINKSRVKEFYSSGPTSHGLAGFVVDMFCTAFADVASEFEVPAYVFFTSGACSLSLWFYLQFILDDQNQDITEFKDSGTELSIPGFVNPVPTTSIPYAFINNESARFAMILDVPRKSRKTKGILVNTFVKLESHIIKCLSEDNTIPPIYAVGPMLNLETQASNDQNDIVQWLDSKAPASVVFLCFGSMGSFQAEQVVEIATALEKSGHPFLWSLRKPAPKDKFGLPSDYDSFDEVLPEGFLDRTKEIGKVIGWAPQVAVLSHPAVGGFISHCGWNSTLESLWFGVPMATWPLYAEQQVNAFEMVKELDLAVEIKLDYRSEIPVIVTAEEIERGIKQLMEGNESTKIREKVKAMSEESRKALVEGGSSYTVVGRFIKEVLNSSS